MDNLDALLEDLRVTKQHVLQRNSPIFGSNGNERPPEPNFWSSASSNPADFNRNSRSSTSIPRRPLQENLNKLDRILNNLDKIDGDPEGHASQDTSAGPVDQARLERQSTNGGSSDSISLRTKEAAEHASRQLDELMASLQQLKQQTPLNTNSPYNQTQQQASSPSAQPHSMSQNTSVCVGQAGDATREPRWQPGTEDVPNSRKTSTDSAAPSRPNNGDATASQLTWRGSLCVHCGQPVIGKVITALGGVWHPEHFTCSYCQKNVVEEFFYDHEGVPYCTECHLSLFAPKCAFCGEAIVDRCLEAMGYFWHPDHFFCQGCHIPFVDNATAHEHQGKIFCSNCYYSKFGERCGGCRQPITDAYITVLEQPWHEGCFKCKDCGVKLTGRSFHAENGYPYCEQHHRRNSGMVCAACREPIVDSRCINALGSRYHLQHFVCAYCLRQLSTGTFKERLGKPYCDSCFHQLFG